MIKYLWYVIKHRWFVMFECFKVGQIWLGLIHDLSKFRLCEFFPYANHFKEGIKKGRSKTGYYKPYDTGDPMFDIAWLKHIHANKHHWQYWTQPTAEIGIHCHEIPFKYIEEMVCDFKGASQAQGHKGKVKAWYQENKNKMVLHENTREILDKIMEDEN